jgi:hypothetical protein
MKDILQSAIDNRHTSKLPREGWQSQNDLTGRFIRNILNNICSKIDSYLEIGLYRGGTFSAALWGNEIHAVGVDDWSQNWGIGSSKDEFLSKYLESKGYNTVDIYDMSCWDVDLSAFKFDAYLFDGPHGYTDQYDALVKFIDQMNNQFIYIVDDYDNEKSPLVVKGVQDSILDLKLKKTSEFYFPAGDGFHEGIYFCSLEKV